MLDVGDIVFYVDMGREYDPAYHILFLIMEGPQKSKSGHKTHVGIKSLKTGDFRWANIKDLSVFSKSP